MTVSWRRSPPSCESLAPQAAQKRAPTGLRAPQAAHALTGGRAVQAAVAAENLPGENVGGDDEHIHEFFAIAPADELRSEDFLHPLAMHPAAEFHRLPAQLVAVLLRLQP